MRAAKFTKVDRLKKSLIGLCEDWEDKKEKLLWDGIGMEIKCLPKGMRAECVQRLVVGGLLYEGYELW